MHISKIKNFVIIILLVAAVYQTGKLWLGDMAGHNFFYTIISAFGQEKQSPAEEGDILLPGRFAVGKGNQKYSVFYPTGKWGAEMMEASNDLLSEVISQGIVVSQDDTVDYKKIQASKCVVFQYDFLSPLNIYINQKAKNSVQGQMTHFDSIAILPPKSNSDMTSVYFMNQKTEQCVLVTLSKSRYGAALYAMIDSCEDGLIYVSTAQSGFKIFQGNAFVPQWTQNAYTYPLLTAEMPFEKDGMVNRGLLENSVDSFFKNFAADWTVKDDSGTYLFSDENIVVRYYPEGILEYYNYDLYDEEKVTGLLEGYQACKRFLQTDKSLKTDVYLSYVRIRSNEIIYYFDYQVNNFPIVFSDSLRRSIAAEHAIEIIVQDRTVRKYRRYACNFSPSTVQTGEVTIDFLAALNKSILEYQLEENTGVVTEVGDVYLAYLAENTDNIPLKWFCELYGQLFMQETNTIVDATD